MSRDLASLVHPPPYGEVPFKHLGLCSVAAGLRAAGLDTRYLDASERFHRQGEDFYDALILRLSAHAGDMTDLPRLDLLGEVLFPEEGDSPLAAEVRRQAAAMASALEGAPLVGITVNTLTAYAAAALGDRLRRGGTRVLMGGPPCAIPALSHLLLRLGAADAILVGEGDLAAAPIARALVDGKSPAGLAGAAWLEGDHVVEEPPLPPPELSALPRPELEGNLLDDFLPAGASRGCRRRCVYCSEPGLWQGFRRRDPVDVAGELRQRRKETGIADVHFHDDLLNSGPRWLDRLVEELRHEELSWESFFEPYGLTEERIEAMAGGGCRLVKLGVQSFSPKLLGIMGRPPRVESITEAIAAIYDRGISTHFDMLIGHPGETEADHQDNLRAIEALYERTGDGLYFSLNPYYVAAGSAPWCDPSRFGVELRGPDLDQLPGQLAEAVRRGPAYPEGYRSDVPRDTIMGRMAELAKILQRHDKDYLYLGQQRAPEGEGRTMLQPLPRPADAARRRGAGAAAATAVSLESRSNLEVFPSAAPATSLVEAAGTVATLEAALRAMGAEKIRITGGEPTLSPSLPRLLAVARAMGIDCRLETNGLRLAEGGGARLLARAGLGSAVVVLLGVEAASADRLGGIEGGHALALEGARALSAAGVDVSLGLLVSDASLPELPELPALAARTLPGSRSVHVLVSPLDGRDPPKVPDREDIDQAVDGASAAADKVGIEIVVEQYS